MKIEKINDKEHLNEYIRKKLNKIKNVINENNKTISGVKFEVFAYSDYETELNDDVDYNLVLLDFLINRFGFVKENFTLLSSQDKVYDFLGSQLKRKCRKVVRNTKGGIKITKNNFDYKMKFWIKREVNSRIKKKEKIIIKEEINFIFKIILMKYN